jgi:hypothetical protein
MAPLRTSGTKMMMTWRMFGAVPAWALAPHGQVVPGLRTRAEVIGFMFDRSNYRPDREEDDPITPAPRKGQERVLLTLVFALLALAFVLPVSAAGLSDIVRYFEN